MDKGPAGRHHVLVGVDGKHNYLLGGYGDDTIYGGKRQAMSSGATTTPAASPAQTAIIHAGDGKNFIYANDTLNYVWTGTNPGDGRARARGRAASSTAKTRAIVVFTSHHALAALETRGLPRT